MHQRGAKHRGDMSDQKSITLTPNQSPVFVGVWTIGEIRQMAQGLATWLDAIPLNIGKPNAEINQDERNYIVAPGE